MIQPDGSPNTPVKVTPELIEGGKLYGLDGIALDAHGFVYGVLPAATGMNAMDPPPEPLTQYLVRVNPATGDFDEIPVDASQFDFPTSLVFGTGGAWNRKNVFIVNSDLLPDPNMGSGPNVVEVYVGKPGMPGK